jgi:hypothetical protein
VGQPDVEDESRLEGLERVLLKELQVAWCKEVMGWRREGQE